MKEEQQGMSVIVKTVTRLTVGLILLYGVYILLHGHLTPGGGFVGGIVLALSLTHLLLAFGQSGPGLLSRSGAAVLESVGAALFVGIALAGFLGGVFFRNFLPSGTPFELLSAGIIPFANIAISLKVGAGLFSIFLAIVFLRFDWEKPS